MTQAFNLALLANKINSSGQLNADTGLYNNPIPVGSVFLLYQSAAPTGWTQVTSLNDYALRIVSGVGGTTGGTTAFSTVFTNQTPTISGFSGFSAAATTLSTTQIPSHGHTVQTGFGYTGSPLDHLNTDVLSDGYNGGSIQSLTAGGGGSHTHSISGGSASSTAITLNVRYANIILCSKN